MRINIKTIERMLRASYKLESFEKNDRAAGYLGQFEDDTRIRFVIVDGRINEGEQGIHIHSLKNKTELEYHLTDALETCFKDGFTTVWIHNKRKPSQERRDSKLKCAKDWLSSLGKRVDSNYSLKRTDADNLEALESMTEDQLAVLVAMVSGACIKGHSEGREYWAPKYHNLRNELKKRISMKKLNEILTKEWA
jgi:hypothetical protein